jgi:hypothetical protein
MSNKKDLSLDSKLTRNISDAFNFLDENKYSMKVHLLCFENTGFTSKDENSYSFFFGTSYFIDLIDIDIKARNLKEILGGIESDLYREGLGKIYLDHLLNFL